MVARFVSKTGKPGPLFNYDPYYESLFESPSDSMSELDDEALTFADAFASLDSLSLDSESDELSSELVLDFLLLDPSESEPSESSVEAGGSSILTVVVVFFGATVTSVAFVVESSLPDKVIDFDAVSEPAAAVIVTDPVKPSGGSKAAANVPFALDVTVPVPEPPVTLAPSLTEVASAKSLPWTTTRPSIVERPSVGVPVAAFAAGIPIASTSTPAAAPAISRRDFPVVDPVIQVGRS